MQKDGFATADTPARTRLNRRAALRAGVVSGAAALAGASQPHGRAGADARRPGRAGRG